MKVKIKKNVCDCDIVKLADFYADVFKCMTKIQKEDGYIGYVCSFSGDFCIEFIKSNFSTSPLILNFTIYNLIGVEEKLLKWGVPYKKDDKKRCIITHDPCGNEIYIEQETLFFSLPRIGR